MIRTTRASYWSNSKVSKYLQKKFCGVEKPSAASLEEWDDIENRTKKACPFIHWLTEEFFDKVQDFVNFPNDALHSIRYYIQNRWVTKTHYLKTGLKPGDWNELDTRILHGLFTELVDFIEVEKAWMQVVFDGSGEIKKKYNYPSWRNGIFRYGVWRSPEAGLDHLNWEISLGDESLGEYEKSPIQAANAKEQLELYNWWKNVRPNRPDPYEASGWSKLCEQDGWSLRSNITPEHRKSLELLNEIEQAQENEDEEMLIRLIKIRKSLWT